MVNDYSHIIGDKQLVKTYSPSSNPFEEVIVGFP